jgi:ABC-type branched-subunit amino acid transport system ATPase component/branched-subunit amino acid ABC-type transport system permease component
MAMSGWAFYAIVGVGPGAMLGLLALGLVFVYRGTGVLNLAHTSQAAIGAYTYFELSSRLNMPLGLALCCAVLSAGASGVAIQLAVMRPLQSASPLTKLIASTGVLLIIQASLLLIFTSESYDVPSLLPAVPIHLFGRYFIGSDRLLLVAIAVVLTLVLWLVYRFSTYGALTAAVAENPVAGALLGRNASAIAVGNWFVGGALAGLAGALLVPISGLNLTAFLALIVPVLAAALGGGLTSFPMTILVGIIIGVAQSETTAHTSALGSGTVSIFVILIIVMLLRGRAIPARGYIGTRLPSLGSGRIRWPLAAGALVLAMILVWFLLSVAWNQALLTSMLVAIPMLSIVVVTGYAGQVSLAQYALAGVGAYVAAQIAQSHRGVPFLLLLLCGGIGALPIGYLLALTSRLMRGASLAIITLGFSVLLYETVFSSSYVVTIPDPTIFGIDLTPLLDPRRYLTLTILIFAIFAIMIANMRRGQTGRQLIAVRDNERAASSLGINVNRSKTTAFTISAFVAAVGGVLIAFSSTAVVYYDFDPLSSISQLGWTVIGGVGYIAGPLLGMGFASGGIGNQLITDVYNDQFSWLPLLGGILLVLTILLNPDGVTSVNIAMVRRLTAWRKPGAGSRVPKAPATPAARTKRRSSLEVADISISFGAVEALRNVSLKVDPGQVHGLIGPNGAGKTTLIDVISGFARNQGGSVTLGGKSLDRLGAWRRARLGIGRSFQSLELFADLNVYDNIRAASEGSSRGNVLRDLLWPRDTSLSAAGWEAVRMLGLEDVLPCKVDELSYGKRRLVAIARALATNSDVVLLDEPAAGLDDAESAELRGLVRRIADEGGLGVLLIEHDVELVMTVSDQVTALDFGAVIAHGSPDDVRSDPAVIASYLGRKVQDLENSEAVAIPELGDTV